MVHYALPGYENLAMKIALGQINPTVGDLRGNQAKIIEFARSAKAAGASLVVFPELAICGYPPMDMLLKAAFVRANLQALENLAQSVTDIQIVVGFVDQNSGPGRPLFNACALLAQGKIVHKQYKTLLPSYDVFDEDRYFEPASAYNLFHLENVRFGLSICEDVWNDLQIDGQARYHADPIAKIVGLGAEVILNLSSSPFDLGKYKLREEIVSRHATKYGVPIVYVNQVGGNDQLIFDGRSFVVDGSGSVVARASAFSEELLIVEYENNGKLITGPINDAVKDDAAETHAALVLGTRDYLRKCGFNRAVIGLSGGIDSAVTCAIACDAIGAKNVIGVSMPSPYSSEGSIEDAKQLASNLGIELKIIPIEPVMKAYTDVLAPTFAGKTPDVTEENIQARIRGAILMALSNKSGALVLATGNKSELAVGYCTLYGDMCGGLSVISDVPKLQVYALANYINTKRGLDLIPQSTIEKAPSAELKPNQTDQDTLPPYAVLDGIISAYVEQRLESDEIIKLGFKAEVVQDVIARIDHNEYKRKQAAPGLKITPTAFGVGWRMPIAQSFDERLEWQNESSLQVLC
jgi:NAD+ synthase (glutamine-hydrolysing)